jgi:sarcinarray family protein
MRPVRSILCPLVFLLLVLTASPSNAGDCAYGSVKAWFRASGGEWLNATAHPMLHRGETFDIKISVTVTTDLLVVYVKLHEFGTPVYEVISGPSRMEQILEHKESFDGDHSWTLNWTMRVRANTSWVNGSSPLEVFVQFTKNQDDDATVTFDIINAYILHSLWVQYPLETNRNDTRPQEEPAQLPAPSLCDSMMVIVLICLLFFRPWRLQP